MDKTSEERFKEEWDRATPKEKLISLIIINSVKIVTNSILGKHKAAMNKSHFDKGDRIQYQYTHHLNSSQTTQVIKNGTYIRKVKRRKTSLADWDATPKCVVQLEGNKHPSIVWQSKIKHCE